jgi:hypothetical protein
MCYCRMFRFIDLMVQIAVHAGDLRPLETCVGTSTRVCLSCFRLLGYFVPLSFHMNILHKRLTRKPDLVQPALTAEILAAIKPVIVISGDDHDDCTSSSEAKTVLGVYTHVHNNISTIEHTLATFSWLQGNRYPAFGMLSLRESHIYPYTPQAPPQAIKTCSLPPQLPIYGWYAALYVLTVLFHLRRALRRGTRRRFRSFVHELGYTTGFGLLFYAAVLCFVWWQ